MSVFCCKQLKGWCKSFTRTELYLTVLQLIFLFVLVASLTFIVLHFLACKRNENRHKIEQNNEVTNQISDIKKENYILDISTTKKYTNKYTPLPKDIECTWTPSDKTTAVTHYYDPDLTKITSDQHQTSQIDEQISSVSSWSSTETISEEEELYDGKEADEITKGFLLALVKIKPSQDIIFGCTLTVVALSWTITAASCIEAIEEVDSLDSFTMMQNFGEKVAGNIHTVSDIMIHPQYQGINKSYDLAALKSEDIIVKDKSQVITLPTTVDYLSVTIGEKLSILGYGKYRSLDKDPRARSVREVSVLRLPAQQCGEGADDAWALRHLAAGSEQVRGACGAGALCAGGSAGGPPCRYCSGTPLFLPRVRVLLGLMSDNPHCGLTCDPVLYVNLAPLRDWLDSVIDSD